MPRSYIFAGSAATGPELAEQFNLLINSLDLYGFSIVQASKADFFISINHDEKSYRRFIANGGEKRNTVLIVLEPPAVFPSQYLKRNLNKYGLILRPGSKDFDNDSFMPWPYENVPNPLFPQNQYSQTIQDFAGSHANPTLAEWKMREFNLVMINANKVSPAKHENYSLRRRYALLVPSNSLKVFGYLWNDSLSKKVYTRLGVIKFSFANFFFPNFRSIYGNLFLKFPSALGPIDDKQVVLRKSKFAIVIENDNTYVSEKIIDCFVNGCVPVYYGYDLEYAGISNQAYLELPKNPGDLIGQLDSLNDVDILKLLEHASQLIKSDTFQKSWNSGAVYQRIAKRIHSYSEGENA